MIWVKYKNFYLIWIEKNYLMKLFKLIGLNELFESFINFESKINYLFNPIFLVLIAFMAIFTLFRT